MNSVSVCRTRFRGLLHLQRSGGEFGTGLLGRAAAVDQTIGPFVDADRDGERNEEREVDADDARQEVRRGGIGLDVNKESNGCKTSLRI